MHPVLVSIDIRRNALVEWLIDGVAVLCRELKIRIWGNFCFFSGDHRPSTHRKAWLTTNWLPFAQHVSKNFNNNLAK